ncbi:MAG: SPFH domain-containing protein [Nevskia sp.]|nr:SPFH domain-containing protein [Nevskia sp.]
MAEELRWVLESLGKALVAGLRVLGAAVKGVAQAAYRLRLVLVLLALLGGAGYALYRHPPMQTLAHGEVGIRSNRLTGSTAEFREGPVLVLSGLHALRRYWLHDSVYRPVESSQANGAAPFQSLEGLSVGVDLSVRYALDPDRIAGIAGRLPDDIEGEVVAPAVQGVIFKIFTRYTVKEIFSTKRAEIQQAIEDELKPRLAADGILLRGVLIGKVDLPADYRAGMEKLLAEELETEKMRYTLQLKDQQVKQSELEAQADKVKSELEAEADKVKREKAAEAAGNEQVIAARAQEEEMKHVLPFKEKQIEQRKLEAEAEKLARIKTAEGTAEARRIEAAGEADSRQKLADAEAYRLEHIGKITSAQMERDGELLSKHPLLIQKTMADKLSDKVSVIIAPPPASGGFIGSALLGQGVTAVRPMQTDEAPAPEER